MQINIIPALMLVISASGFVTGQTSSDLQQVALYSFSSRTGESRSAVNFETGKRSEFNNFAGFHLSYGGVLIQEGAKDGRPGKVHPDWLRVVDSRSMIVDLGARNWQDFRETPPFPKPKIAQPPPPLGPRPFVVEASAGSKDFSPYRQMVEVEPGHMYLVRVSDKSRIFYAMFRVESLDSRVSCVVSFKVVKPPNVDDEK